MVEQQQQFARDAARLILHAFELGYAVTLGEAYRTPEQAARDADKGIGIRSSLHCNRLAIDLQLFVRGEYQKDTRDYEELGLFWESLGANHCWGGRFSGRPDGNHFSLSPDGGRTR